MQDRNEGILSPSLSGKISYLGRDGMLVEKKNRGISRLWEYYFYTRVFTPRRPCDISSGVCQFHGIDGNHTNRMRDILLALKNC